MMPLGVCEVTLGTEKVTDLEIIYCNTTAMCDCQYCWLPTLYTKCFNISFTTTAINQDIIKITKCGAKCIIKVARNV